MSYLTRVVARRRKIINIFIVIEKVRKQRKDTDSMENCIHAFIVIKHKK